MLVRRIHVETLLADTDIDADLTDLELYQEHEEQRLVRAHRTQQRRRPFFEDRARRD
ncbi:MAG: hypothetical protein M3O74_13745 [Pseudomonadota bacterium]|nr:hypothetical protein [Pseudomonadota bacterium]